MRSANTSRKSLDVESAAGEDTCLAPFLVLEICRGRTEHRWRPVENRRFLIGASPHCDLRLGGPDMPPLLALLVVDGSEAWIEAMGTGPALKVNDRVEIAARLNDGDRIRFASFEFVAHLDMDAAAEPSGGTEGELGMGDPIDDEAEHELSAAELVERIESATQLVEDFERRERVGIEALLDAVQQRRRPSIEPADLPLGTVLPLNPGGDETGSTRMLDELEALAVQLSAIVAELERGSGLQWRREAGYADALSTLLDAQDRLSRQLEILLRRVASLNADGAGREPGRAIA